MDHAEVVSVDSGEVASMSPEDVFSVGHGEALLVADRL